MENIYIPADIPAKAREDFRRNYKTITHNTGRLMLFAGDQKVEHLNDDYFGKGISSDDSNPKHLFSIASKANIGVFAAQLGLIARYGTEYKNIPYLVKLNSKTHLIPKTKRDPLSSEWFTVEDVVEFKVRSKLNITAVGYTVYFGSEYEHIMLRQAAHAVFRAHQHGLVAVIWAYPRGKYVKNEKDPHLIAGAAGAAACLGADFVKVNAPESVDGNDAQALKEAVQAAGTTRVVCAGGSSTNEKSFLTTLYNQITIAGTSGNATGRNIHQKSERSAIAFCNAIYAITVEGKTPEQAVKLLK